MRSLHIPKLLVGAAMVALVSVPAVAQTPQPNQRGYVVGFGGLSATQVNSALFGAGAGFNVTRDLVLTVDAGRMQDVQASFTHQDLATVDSAVTAITSVPLASTVKMPTNYVMGGARYLIPVRGNVRPYVAGAGGIAHMSPKPTFSALGVDITSTLLTDSESGPILTTTFREETRPMASLGGGVMITIARHLTFDVGYRYSGIFIKTHYLQASDPGQGHSRIDVHRVYAGMGVTF